MMRRLPLLLIAMTSVGTGVGCEIWKAPDRVHQLEGRVNELSAELSAITGKAVGAGKQDDHGKTDKAADEHGKGDKADKAKDEHDDDKPKGGRSEKPDKHADASDKHGSPPKDVDASEGPVGLDIRPNEEKSSVADLAKKAGQDFDNHDKHEKPHWAYEGPNGFMKWGSLDEEWKSCSKGKAQSPIDITPHASSASPIEFHYKPTAATIVDNGHTGQVNLAPGSTIEIDKHTYELVQFHYHTPSEHTIAGEHFPLEVHLVHKDAAGKLAVIGVMYDAGPDSHALEPLYTKWPSKKEVEGKLGKPFNPLTLLPETKTVYRYSGSLTTPPCSEGVVWNVMRRPMSETKQHLSAIAAHYTNARPVQELGDRRVQ